MKKYFIALVFLCLSAYSHAGVLDIFRKNNLSQGVPRINCPTPATEITIDGNAREWKDNLTPVINKKTAFGICSDDEFIYILLVTSDRDFSMQMMNFGLSVWFDPQGVGHKTVGVQFPVIQLQPPPPQENGGKPPVGEDLKRFLDERLRSIIIEFPDKKEMKELKLPEAKKRGIEAMIGVDTKKNTICYEMKYPLSKASAEMGMDLSRQKSLAVCVETPEVDPSKLKEIAENHQQSPGEGKSKDSSERDIVRPPKQSESAKPPKPTKKPSGDRISQWIMVDF